MTNRSDAPAAPTQADPRIQLAAEDLDVTRAVRVTGRVQVQTRTTERAETVALDLRHDEVEIERVAIGTPIVGAAPGIRREGDVTIVPVIEEMIVVERRLVLKEEIRIRRVTRTERHSEQVVLRSEHAEIRRLPADSTLAGKASAKPS